MKTLEELYGEVMASDELKAQLAEVTDGEGLAAFAAANGVETTAEDALVFLAGKSSPSRELSADELDAAAGGKETTGQEAWISVVSVGVGCAVYAAVSAATGDCGTAIEGKGVLCQPHSGDYRGYC